MEQLLQNSHRAQRDEALQERQQKHQELVDLGKRLELTDARLGQLTA